jgi:hypothetical protein
VRLFANATPCYIKDLSFCRFWYLWAFSNRPVWTLRNNKYINNRWSLMTTTWTSGEEMEKKTTRKKKYIKARLIWTIKLF